MAVVTMAGCGASEDRQAEPKAERHECRAVGNRVSFWTELDSCAEAVRVGRSIAGGDGMSTMRFGLACMAAQGGLPAPPESMRLVDRLVAAGVCPRPEVRA